MEIRTASVGDAEQILEIYAPYVAGTAVSFEYDVPSAEEFRSRIGRALTKYPYLVAEEGRQIIGYAYASAFKDRAAYERSVEVSIYVRKGMGGRGVGRALYGRLDEELRKRGILNAYACIAIPVTDNDPYLSLDSMKFHERMGYRLCGTFSKCGNKFNRWYDMVWMEKMLGEHGE